MAESPARAPRALVRRFAGRGRRRLRRALVRAGVAGARRLGYEVERVPPGARLMMRPLEGGGKKWLKREKLLFDHLARAQVAALLEMYEVNCVIDVGAHRGQYARRLRAGGYTGHIVSFEPVPEVFERLARGAAKDPRWSAHRLALGREEGEATMNVVPGTLSSLLPANEFGARRYAQLNDPVEVRVPVRRLDSLLDELTAGIPDPRPYLKLDTQGFDLDVFAGVGERIGEFVGMQSEVALLEIYEGMPGIVEALETYRGAGFEITGMFPVSRESRTGRVVEYDCVLARTAALPARA